MYSFSISLWTQRGRAAIRFGLVADTLEPDTRFHQRAVPRTSTATAGGPVWARWSWKKAWKHKRRAPTAATSARTRPPRRRWPTNVSPTAAPAVWLRAPLPPIYTLWWRRIGKKTGLGTPKWPVCAHDGRRRRVPFGGRGRHPSIVREVEPAHYTGAQQEDDDQVASSQSRDTVCVWSATSASEIDGFPSHRSACRSTDRANFPCICRAFFDRFSYPSHAPVQNRHTPRGPTASPSRQLTAARRQAGMDVKKHVHRFMERSGAPFSMPCTVAWCLAREAQLRRR